MYRAVQFFRALGARVHPEESRAIRKFLAPAQQELFHRMSRDDQRHALDVFHTLRRQGHADRSLLQAALLHDVGKAGSGLRLWHRVLIVLLDALTPKLVDRIAQDAPNTWRYPFFAHRHHPQRGAALAEDAGSSPLTIGLIRHHQEPVSEEERTSRQGQLLLALQAADGKN